MKKIIGGALAVLAIATWSNAAEPKPNVLFIFTDDQRADTIAALGNAHIKTPNLDRLCHDGLAFNRAYMQGSFNIATCIPSRAMLMSGQSLFHVSEKLKQQETWPGAFGRAGYRTFISGKWHNGNESLLRSFQQGQAIFLGGMGNPMEIPLWDLANGAVTPEAKAAQRHSCERMADAAIRFLKGAHDKPFFCYVPFDAPHDPHIVPEDFSVRYDPAKIPLPANFLPQHPFDNGEMHVRDENLLSHPRTSADVRQMIADYYRYITYIDMEIGRILAALDASPYAKNTIVVFSSDSGVARGSHGLIGKQNLYEYDSLRVPLIVAGPGIPAGKTTEAMCYLYDLLPTLGAVCGVPGPKCDGLNLSAVLHDPSRPGRPDLVFAYKAVQRAIETAEWKLIHYPKVDQTQLFNLRDDPYEVHNLAGDPKYAARLAEMNALLQKKLVEAGGNEPQGRDDTSGKKRGKKNAKAAR